MSTTETGFQRGAAGYSTWLMQSGRQRSALVGFFATALLVWSTLPAIGSFFTADDFLLVAVGVPNDAADALRYFRTDWGGSETGGTYYRPVVNLSLWLNSALTGLSPLALRLTGMCIHLCVSALLVVIGVRRLTLPADTAILAGGIFLVFPLHDVAILWIAARVDLLCALFYLLAFIGLTSRSLSAQLCGSVAFAASLASKEMAMTLPGVVLAWWIMFSQYTRRTAIARPVGIAALVLIAYAMLRVRVLGGIGGDPAFFAFSTNWIDRAFIMLSWSILPFDLERLRDFARIHSIAIVPLYAIALVTLYLLIRKLWDVRPALFGVLWVAVSMLPVLARPNSWYAYIPSIGGCVLIAVFCRSFHRSHIVLGMIVLAIAGTSLRGGARQMASAGYLSKVLVHAGSKAGEDLLVVNSPIVINRRYGVVTDQSHFDAAASILGLSHRTIPLNYAYIEDIQDSRLSAVKNGVGIVAKADVGRRTFLTLDGIGVADTRAISGQTLAGTRATYRVIEVTRGQIAGLEIIPTGPHATVDAIVAFAPGGQLVKLR